MSLRIEFQMACPQCGNDEELVLLIKVEATLTVDGTEAGCEHDWGINSPCSCPVCEHRGIVSDFLIDDEETAGAS